MFTKYKRHGYFFRWAFLELHTSTDSCDEKQAYAAGFLEGYLTRDLVWMHWQNMLKG